MIAPEAVWWLHADLDAARASEMGKKIVAEIDQRRGPQLRAIKRLFSVNPVTDFGSITLYGDGEKKHAVVMIQGKFNRGHLEDLVMAADQYTASENGGVKVHSWRDNGKRQHAAFVEDELLVFSEHKKLLLNALDVLKSGEGMKTDKFVTAGGAKPILVAVARLSEIEIKGDESKLIGKADTLRIALREASGRMEGRIMLEVGNPKDGERFRRVLDGMVALGELGDSSLEAADIKYQSSNEKGGRVVHAKLSLPSAEMISMIEDCGAFKMIDQ